MQKIVNIKMRNVDIDEVRNLSWLTTNLNLTDDLFQNALLLSNADRLTHEMQVGQSLQSSGPLPDASGRHESNDLAPDRSADRETSLH